MAPITHRVLKRRGRIMLLETANPAMGIGYVVRNGSLSVWNGADLLEAERQFEDAAKIGSA